MKYDVISMIGLVFAETKSIDLYSEFKLPETFLIMDV